MQGRVLIVAGSDSGGGAGLQADLKSVTALGGYAATAITALTAQDTVTVHEIMEVPPAFVTTQIKVVLADIGADAIKTGMLHSVAVVDAVLEGLDGALDTIPLVVDPVMVAKGGAPLLQDRAVAAVRDRLLPHAALLTPNIPEAEILTGLTIETDADVQKAGESLLARGAKAVLMKGGHRPGAVVRDLLLSGDGAEWFTSDRIDTRHTHGTGCTLASSAATGLAQGLPLGKAVARARAYVLRAIETAPGFGKGHGPLNHAHTVI